MVLLTKRIQFMLFVWPDLQIIEKEEEPEILQSFVSSDKNY